MSIFAFDHRRLRIVLAISVALCAVALARPADVRASEGPRFLLAHAPSGVAVHARPGGPVTARIAGATPLRTTTWLWIVDRAADGAWGRAVLPLRPNGRTGWIRLKGLRLVRTTTWVRASLGERRIWLMRGGHAVRTWRAAIGAQGTPTPTGRFSVTDRVLTGDPYGPFGWFAFGLSGHQPNLPPLWSGGDQLAIHGTNEPASIGLPASHGCLRVSARTLAVLRTRIALGTPVIIMRSRGEAQRAARRSSLPRLKPADRRTPVYTKRRPVPAGISVPSIVASVAAAAPLTGDSEPAT